MTTRKASLLWSVGTLAALSGVVALVAGQPLTPPQSQSYGKSFEEWNVLQAQYAIDAGLGDGTVSDTVGNVRLLPYDFFDPTHVFHITVPPGTPLVKSPWNVFGEHYDDPNVRDDDPILDAELLAFIFQTTTVETVLDGQVLVDGIASELEQFQFGPVYFDEPIEYAEPQFRFTNENGDPVNATAALFILGIGSIYKPLDPGEHTLVETVHSLFFGDFELTYYISVTPD